MFIINQIICYAIMSSITCHTCPNTGKKVLYVEMSYSNYNYLVTLLMNDPGLMGKFIKSFHSYQIKYKIEDNPSISSMTEDIDELLSKLSI
jgi:hypothetical protein